MNRLDTGILLLPILMLLDELEQIMADLVQQAAR